MKSNELDVKGIVSIIFSLFEGKTQSEIAAVIGKSNHLIGKWGEKSNPTLGDLKKIVDEKHVSWEWLLTGKEAAQLPPPSNVERNREPIDFVLNAKAIPVVGEAAADESQGRRSGFFPPDPETQYQEVEIPATTAAVRIIGDSMAPVLLGGQYALLGPEYMGQFDQPRNYEIVVADVAVRDDEQAGSDSHWEGVYCKRIVDAGDTWVFLSINATGTPFSIAKSNCRVWPVVGVWFAGQGKIPAEG